MNDVDEWEVTRCRGFAHMLFYHVEYIQNAGTKSEAGCNMNDALCEYIEQ